MPGNTAVGRGELVIAWAYSCGGSYLAVGVRAATGRDLRILCGRRFQLLDDGEIGDRPRNFSGTAEGLRAAPRVGRPDLHRGDGYRNRGSKASQRTRDAHHHCHLRGPE